MNAKNFSNACREQEKATEVVLVASVNYQSKAAHAPFDMFMMVRSFLIRVYSRAFAVK
jgi:hypothetical protein